MREHRKHKIRDVHVWNARIPAGTVVVVDGALIARTVGAAYAMRRNHTLVRVVRVQVAGEVELERLRIPNDLGGEFIDQRSMAI